MKICFKMCLKQNETKPLKHYQFGAILLGASSSYPEGITKIPDEDLCRSGKNTVGVYQTWSNCHMGGPC